MKDENKNLADADDNHSHPSTHSSHASVISPRVVNLATVVVLCLFCISLSIRLSAEERPTPHVYDIRDVRSSGVPLRTSSEVIIPRLYTPLEAFFTAGSDTSICYVGTEEGNAAVLDGDSINNNNNNHGSESCSVCAQQHKDSTIDNILSSGQSFSQSLRDKEGILSNVGEENNNSAEQKTKQKRKESRPVSSLQTESLAMHAFFGCPPTPLPNAKRVSPNPSTADTLYYLPLFERRYNMVPLSQYHHRLPLHAMGAHYLFMKKRHLAQKQLQWWRMTRQTLGSRDTRLSLWAETELEYTSTKFNLLVQRTLTRAHRQADSMRLETLHFLRLFASSVAPLRKVWVGDDMCVWPGVTCDIEYVPLSELLDDQHPVVEQHAQYILTKMRQKNLISKETTFSSAFAKYLLRNLFSSKTRKHYFLRWQGGMPGDGNGEFVYPRQKTKNFLWERLNEELDYGIYFKDADFTPAELYIGSDYSDFNYFTDRETVEQYREKGEEHNLGDQVIVVETTGAITVPFTIVRLDLRQFNLKGILPKIYPVTEFNRMERYKSLFDAYLMTNPDSDNEHRSTPFSRAHLVFSPRQSGYYSTLTDDMPLFTDLRRRFSVRASRLIMYTRQVVTNAERVGTRSRHFDLAVYFSEVAFFSQFWGENIDKMTRPVIPKSSESMREELPEFDFRLHTYRPTLIYEPVVRVDEQPSFGEIVPELVAIESILLTHNPLLGGVMPSEYLSFHFLVLLEAQFTSIMSQAPQVFPFRGNITSKREEREVYEAYYHVFHRQKQMEKPHRFMYGLLGSIDDLGSFLENEYRPTWRKKNNKNHTQTVEKHRGKTYHEVEDMLWSIRGTGLRGYASPILLLASSVRDGSKSQPLLKDAHKPESPSPVSFLQIMFRHGVFRTLGVCWRIGLQEGLRVLEELYQIENLAHD